MEQEVATRPGQIPTICLDESAVAAFGLFNPNDWEGQSRGVVLSCSTEYSVLRYGLGRIERLCGAPRECCRSHIATLQDQWTKAPWDLPKGAYLAQVPELHVLIEAFFAGMKSVLDLMAQLLTTEGVVGVELDGFHTASGVYGGRVLNALANNVESEKTRTAKAVAALIADHKKLWIDQVIEGRHLLIHPSRGAHQLMFEMRLATRGQALVCEEILPPQVGGTSIDNYAAKQIRSLETFARAYLAELQSAHAG